MPNDIPIPKVVIEILARKVEEEIRRREREIAEAEESA